MPPRQADQRALGETELARRSRQCPAPIAAMTAWPRSAGGGDVLALQSAHRCRPAAGLSREQPPALNAMTLRRAPPWRLSTRRTAARHVAADHVDADHAYRQCPSGGWRPRTCAAEAQLTPAEHTTGWRDRLTINVDAGLRARRSTGSMRIQPLGEERLGIVPAVLADGDCRPGVRCRSRNHVGPPAVGQGSK